MLGYEMRRSVELEVDAGPLEKAYLDSVPGPVSGSRADV